MSEPALPVSDNPRIFPPARSLGWVSLLALTALTLLPLLMLLQPDAIPEGEEAGLWITLAVIVPLAGFFGLTLLAFPRIRYEFTADALVLAMPPLLRYRIPFAEIADVRTVTLTPSLWSSMRLPGLALWKVPYPEIGSAYMCATRMSRDILLVTAGDRRYGLTPADEAEFMAALMPRLPAGQASVAAPQ